MKNILDFWGNLLFIPEYPAVLFRDLFLAWHSQFLVSSKNTSSLLSELSRLRNENSALRIQLAKAHSQYILLSGSAFAPSLDTPAYTSSPDIPDIPPFIHSSLSSSSPVKAARVTLRAPMSWWSEFRIDRGLNDGIAQGLPVFSSGYLVGRITAVSPMSSWAELITSPSFMIPAVVDDTRDLGVVCGDGTGSVLLRYIPSGRALKSGMKISTAMVGEQLPPGLPIGTVAGEALVGSDGYSAYKVDLGADLSTLYSVNY